MVTPKTVEVTVGVFVALGFAALFMLALKVSGISQIGGDEGYRISARFDNIGGLKVRAPVALAGVRIGRVSAIGIDPRTFDAVVEMRIERRYDQLPVDTSAKILTSGLLGEQYIGLEPGGAEQVLAEGSNLRLTQSALVLENIIGQFLFSKAAEGKSESGNP